MTTNLTLIDAISAAVSRPNGSNCIQDLDLLITSVTEALNCTLKLWECFVMGLLVLDLAITLCGIGSKIPDAVLPEAESVTVVAFTELLLLLQLLQIVLPVYPATEFETLALAHKLKNQTLCKWVGGLFGMQEAEFAPAAPKLRDDELRAFGLFLVPVAAAVGWKWRRLRRRAIEARREREAAIFARAWGAWEALRSDL